MLSLPSLILYSQLIFLEKEKMDILSWVTKVGIYKTQKCIPGKENAMYKGTWLIQGTLNCGWSRSFNISFLPKKMKELPEDRDFVFYPFCVFHSTCYLRLISIRIARFWCTVHTLQFCIGWNHLYKFSRLNGLFSERLYSKMNTPSFCPCFVFFNHHRIYLLSSLYETYPLVSSLI